MYRPQRLSTTNADRHIYYQVPGTRYHGIKYRVPGIKKSVTAEERLLSMHIRTHVYIIRRPFLCEEGSALGLGAGAIYKAAKCCSVPTRDRPSKTL